MNRLEVASMGVGAALVTFGASLIYLPAGTIVLGVLLLAAGWPK